LILVWRAFAIGYRRGYRRDQAELRHELEAVARETRKTIDHLREANPKAVEDRAVIQAVRREIAQLKAIHGGADEQRDEAPRLH
jgi:hypothetical protein